MGPNYGFAQRILQGTWINSGQGGGAGRQGGVKMERQQGPGARSWARGTLSAPTGTPRFRQSAERQWKGVTCRGRCVQTTSAAEKSKYVV